MAEIQIIDNDVQYYLNHIAAYEREFTKWESRVVRILKRYRDDTRSSQDTGSRFNILWSNVQTLKAATFAKLPKPDVSRRFRDNDAVGRVASLILERALDYEITHYGDYKESLTSSIYDRFLGGRGVAWVRYEPRFKPMQTDDLQITEDTENEAEEYEQPSEELDYECAPTDYVHWKDFGHNVARTWEETSIVWRKVYMTRQMLVERFGDEGKSVPLDSQPDEMKNATKENVEKRALVYEMWDKDKSKAYWLSKSQGKFLDEKDDPLELEGFYPCPKPLYATITNENLVPVPDFALYQDQANSLDILSDRIDGLVKALQVKGVYDAGAPELSRLFTEGENNSLIPVKNWNAFAEKQGLKGAIDMVDITPIAQGLVNAYQAFEQVKSQVYDITGISDIVRGQSVASETATAQQIKGQYASLRLKSYQDDVAQFATGLIQLKAQIICKHFDPQTILMISAAEQLSEQDQELIPQALELLKNEPMRSFRIEISTDSMINIDENKEKQDRVEFLGAVSGYIEKAVQAAQVSPEIVPMMLDLLKFGVTGFKVGKSVEGMIDQTAEQLKEQMAQKAQQPPQPDPEQMKAQAQAQMSQMQMQADAQQKQAEMEHNMQIEGAKMQANQQSEQLRMQADAEKFRLQQEAELQKAQFAAQLENIKQENAKELEAQRLEFERWKVIVQENNKLRIAGISKSTDSEGESMEGDIFDKILVTQEQSTQDLADKLNSLIELMQKPRIRKLVHDENGRPVSSVETLQ
ncbi:MAG: hypothetical protein WC733_03490 [Methylophilus sp.]|jgi:hypothetical protein